MQYEQELALLLEKIAYWTPERIRDFYSGSAPPCKKYGEDWSQVWEQTDLGLIIIYKKYTREYIEIALYGNDGMFYRLNQFHGDQDWNVWRELYLTSFETGAFRIEVPIHYELIPVNNDNWAFSVSSPPTGDIGTNPYDCWMAATDSKVFMDQLIEDIDVFSKNLNTVTTKYGVGMTHMIFCGATRWKNDAGYYFMAPGDYRMTYKEAATIGIAMLKVAHVKKLNIFHDVYTQGLSVEEIDLNDYVTAAKQRWIL